MAADLVLIGFDGTPAADRVVREAAALFGPRRALVVTVWEPGRAFDLALIPARGFELPLSTVDIRTAAKVEQAQHNEAARLARWGAQLASDNGLRAEGLAVADDLTVADTLVRLAKERDAAVVVVGAHRHGRLAQLLLGSTSRGVVEKAPCPVLVVRGA